MNWVELNDGSVVNLANITRIYLDGAYVLYLFMDHENFEFFKTEEEAIKRLDMLKKIVCVL